MAPGPPPVPDTQRNLDFLESIKRSLFSEEDSEPSIMEDGDNEVIDPIKLFRLEEENKRMKKFIKDIINNQHLIYSRNYLKNKLEELGVDLSDDLEVKIENKKEENYIKNRLKNIE